MKKKKQKSALENLNKILSSTISKYRKALKSLVKKARKHNLKYITHNLVVVMTLLTVTANLSIPKANAQTNETQYASKLNVDKLNNITSRTGFFADITAKTLPLLDIQIPSIIDLKEKSEVEKVAAEVEEPSPQANNSGTGDELKIVEDDAFIIEGVKVDRVKTLETFFKKYNSPLAAHAQTFVNVADQYNIDYRLLPAISCMESTCAKFMPHESNNPFGWGVYGNSYISFANYDEAIETVGAGLNKGYFSKGLDTIEEIAPVYTPPNYVHWQSGVKYFTNKISEIEQLTSTVTTIETNTTL
ncbi:MAG: hypothetical protein R3B92_00395 [Patescibacteria group bacterium]|uniref:Mannosyl-glycoprotein endo-beta-N-acetylglucosamidase-like domain-containing protein n=1 Tax=candidate division WWE3 bacterium TaxID=2053526 RepID=A0A955J1L7_UNCKA|nr:hypothetical protein [candidate division WWE3 bacterium]